MGGYDFAKHHLELFVSKSFLLTLMSLSVLVSCGGGGGGKNKFKFSGDEALTAENPQVSPDYSFREGMGLLFIKNHGDLSVCTSFMISQTHLMTNSHCLSDMSLTQSCSANVGVHVRTQNGFEFRKCNRIVSKSKISGSFTDPDFAVIELDSALDVRPMNLSREGVVEAAELTIESVDYSQDSDLTIHGRRKISRCSPHMNGAMGNYTEALSSILPVFGDAGQTCKIIKGNSGSPVFNRNGKVVSVLFATVDKEALRNQVRVRNPKDMGLVTNLSCIITGVRSFDALRSPDCDRVVREESQYLAKVEERLKETAKVDRKKKAESLKANLPTSFNFVTEEVDAHDDKFSFNFLPLCMMKPAGWSETEKQKIQTTPAGRKYSTSYNSYSYKVSLEFDEYLRPSLIPELTPTDTLELIVENIDAPGPQVSVKIARTLNGRVTTPEQKVALCP